MEKPKNKPKPQPIEVNQNAIFFLITLLIGIMIFFRLDVIIGAIGLQEVYPILNRVVFMTLIIIMLYLLMIWYKIKVAVGYLLILVVFYFSFMDDLPIRGAELIIATLQIILPTSWLLFAFIAVIIIWFITNRFKFTIPNAIIIFVAIMSLFFASFYVLGSGGREMDNYDTFLETIEFADHVYYLSRYCCWDSALGRSLKLYECNSVAIFCEEVFNDWDVYEEWYRWDDELDVHLQPDSQTNQLNIIVDGEILYQHKPS